MTLDRNAVGVASRGHKQQRARDFRSERGGARFRLLVWIVILIAFVFCSYKLVPPYFANYQLQDWLRVHTTFYVVKPVSDDQIKSDLLKEFQELGIPADKDSIKIKANNNASVVVQVDYTVTVDMWVYEAHLHFTPSGDGESLVQ